MVDSSDFETDVGTMDVYARGADPVYVTAPSSSQQEEGVKPLDRLPAQWWNWFLHEATNRFSNYKSYISNALAELDNLLDLSAITPDDTKINQLKGMFENDYLQKYLPEVVSDASTFAVDASKESSILVSNDDGSNGFDVKKVPYSPCLIYNAQSISTVKTITLPANSPYNGQTFKVVFKNGHNCANASTPMTLNGKPVLVNVYGTLSSLPIHTMTEGGGTVYKSLQPNTVLDIYYNTNYDGNNNDAFVIIGNPLVLSSATYSIYADGQIGNEPIGTIIAQYKKSNPLGYLYLDGSTFDTTKYANLYAYLGSDTLPDYREFALVGAEQNSHDTIYSHDVYTQGQSKDDQYQGHSHMLKYDEDSSHWRNSLDLSIPTTSAAKDGTAQLGNDPTIVQQMSIIPNPTWSGATFHERWGDVTRGKRKAVFWYIKY